MAGPFLFWAVIRPSGACVSWGMRIRISLPHNPLKAAASLLAALTASAALADIPPDPLAERFKTPVLRGQAEFRFLGRPMYQAEFYAPEAGQQQGLAPSALELTYQRAFSEGLLVWASMAELRRLEGERADHADFESALETCFSDVVEGDRYLALAANADDLEFWLNGEQACQISGAGWSDRFLSIWLSENARDPRLARVLMGRE